MCNIPQTRIALYSCYTYIVQVSSITQYINVLRWKLGITRSLGSINFACYVRCFVMSVVKNKKKTKKIYSLGPERLVCYIRCFVRSMVISDLFIWSFHCMFRLSHVPRTLCPEVLGGCLWLCLGALAFLPGDSAVLFVSYTGSVRGAGSIFVQYFSVIQDCQFACVLVCLCLAVCCCSLTCCCAGQRV